MKILRTFLLLFLVINASGLRANNVAGQLEAETKKREAILQPFLQTFQKSSGLARQGELEQAVRSLQSAYQELPEALRSHPKVRSAVSQLAEWQATLADQEARNQRWPQARATALAALQLNPGNESAQATLRDSEAILRRGASPGEPVNPALSPQFFDRLSSVQTGLKLAGELRETGQLDLAEKKYEEVLKVDPFNRIATEGIQKIYKERSLVAEESRDLSNLQRRREVREAWNNIYPRRSAVQGSISVAGPMTASPTFQLNQKLKKTVIPQIDFTDADLETIRRALLTLSRQYDPGADKVGINFLIGPEVTNSQPVSLRLRQVSLAEVVRYVAQIAGVKVNLSEAGVKFVPLVETRPDLIPRTFDVSPSFFKDTEGSGEDAAGPRGVAAASRKSEVSPQSEQAKLMDLGVVFPEGAYAVYNRNTSQLFVVNNAEMLDLIGQLISAAEEETLLIQVGVRLIEINQNDLDSITANSTLAGSALSVIPAGLTTNNQGPIPVTGGGWNVQLNQIQGVGLLPNNTLQSFLQTGVLAGTNQPSSYALNTMELGGTILNGMQFRSLITAISQKTSANVLASPMIVLKRGQSGVIEVIQEFRYVQEYNDPQSSIRTIIPPGGGAFNTGVPGPETVISSFPSQISDPVPIGVKMGVEPDVTGDNSRVLLKLKPTFLDFEGFINYGTVVNSAYAAAYFSDAVTILTNNIQQPVFIRRDLDLPAIEVSDGYTLMLGGLLREDIQEIDEKVPLIGDLPILGRAFQGKTEQAIKKNTLIFVTPRILRVDGQPLNPTAGAPATASTAGPP